MKLIKKFFIVPMLASLFVLNAGYANENPTSADLTKINTVSKYLYEKNSTVLFDYDKAEKEGLTDRDLQIETIADRNRQST